MILNPYCRDLGWLLEDLKHQFFMQSPWGDGDVLAHCDLEPVPHADAYIALRSWEITPDTPHPERHVVQFHSLNPRHAGDPGTLNKCAAFVFVHPDQPAMLERLGVSLDRPCLLRPIGAPAGLRLRQSMPEVFTVGWCGRDTGGEGPNDNKRVGLFVDACNELHRQGVPVRAVMLGANLGPASGRLECENLLIPRQSGDPYHLPTYQAFYDGLDVLCITSRQETGPMGLFEALRCGVPVHTTVGGCGWSGLFNVSESSPFSFGLDVARRSREEMFARRHLIRASLLGFTLESWIEDNVRLAMEVARG